MSKQLPKGIQFKNVKPQGFYQEYRDYYVTPVQTYTNQFSVSDVVRMQFNLQDWYLDPYESYLEAEVRLADETKLDMTQFVPYDGSNKVQFLMMDGPSTSLINDFRLEVNSKEIERIREYDQVGNLLLDLNMYPEAVDQKDYEGYYSLKNYTTSTQYTGQQQLQIPSYIAAASTSQYQVINAGSSCPVISSRFFTQAGSGEPVPITNSSVTALGGGAAGSCNLNSLSLLSMEGLAPAGYTGARQVYTAGQIISGNNDTSVGGGQYLQVYNPSQYLGQLTSGNSNFGIQSDQSTNYMGNLYVNQSPKMQQIDGHNIFLTNLPTSKIVNGQCQADIYAQSQNTMQSRAYMQIPLISGVMGVLIPSERWQLIPTSSLGNVNMEFRFNENAFFSHNGQKPNWLVTKFNLKLRLYKFDSAIQNQLKQQVQQGIQMHSQVFSMGPIYNIQSNVSVTNNWQINNGIPSIKNIFVWFLSQDYEQFNYARKNFKVSQNITSMQLKIGSTYIPQTPIIGHAGNICTNSQIPLDNSAFLSELHAGMNMLFDCKKHININKVNFAINNRPYDVTMNTAMGMSAANLTFKKKQMLLDGGYTLWNEMRCRGKSVYTFNLEADKKNDDTMTGIDTTKVRPIELILKSDDPNSYQRNSTMYVMFLSDFIVSFNGNETITEGYG